MKAVSIDYDVCNVCAACIQASAMCFSKQAGKQAVQVDADDKTCVLCGHCVAACPAGAITHNLMDMDNFPPASQEMPVKTDDFISLVRERRSHRIFLNKKIPRPDLERIVDTMRYAPTGHNDQTVELIIVEDSQRRKALSKLTVDYYALVAQEEERKLENLRASGTGNPEQIAMAEGFVGFLKMLVQARDGGFDPIFYEAPAVAIFHSRVATVTPKDNGVIAATMTGLMAKTMGIATTFIALFENAANAYQPLTEELGLPEGHKVYSVLVMGYPKVKYLRAVDRKPIKTRWE
jgi:nitroreductase/NAD-dependent dihydropyrimidine dehydrogenase PreA subunit